MLDFTTIARNIYSNEPRDSISSRHSSQTCDLQESESDLMTLPDQPESELKLGADVKEHFLKVQNQATSAARIKSELLL